MMMCRSARHLRTSFGRLACGSRSSPQRRSSCGSKRPDVPGCLVLDVQLPGLSGLDLQNRMAEIAMEIPIIFITGHGDIPTSVRAMKAGAVAFLIKPFGDHDLIDAIQQGIERDRLTRRRLAKLTEANEALRGCLDALASVRALDDLLGHVMAAITLPVVRES